MSKLQTFFLGILPQRWRQSIEQESQQWHLRCPNCKHERSIWDAGGIRWGAAGKPRRMMTCVQCNQAGWHEVYRR